MAGGKSGLRSPGNESYRPLFSRLNEDHAVVFIHPNTPPETAGFGLLNPFYVWFLDTAKALVSLLLIKFHQDYPNIRYIFAHGGGALAPFAEDIRATDPELFSELEAWRGQLYFDTAKFVTRDALTSLLGFTSNNRVLFSSDFPWAARSKMRYWTGEIDANLPDETDKRAVYRDNARVLFDRNADLPPIGQTSPRSKRMDEHGHAMPANLTEDIKALGIAIPGVEWFDAVKLATDVEKQGRPMRVALDLPSLWELPQPVVDNFITNFNREIAALAAAHPNLVEAYGAVDLSNKAAALLQIGACTKSDQMSGLCVYPKLEGETALWGLDPDILSAMSSAKKPIMVHPRDASGSIILNEQKLAAPMFMARLLYTGDIDCLADTPFVLTHTHGVLRDLADSIGLLFYLRNKRWNLLGFAIDYLLRRQLRGVAVLRNSEWD